MANKQFIVRHGLVSGSTLVIDSSGNWVGPALPANQNLWLNIDADSGGPVAANTVTDTITLTGGTSITTSISGDIVTFTNDAPNVDQNIWLTIAADAGFNTLPV